MKMILFDLDGNDVKKKKGIKKYILPQLQYNYDNTHRQYTTFINWQAPRNMRLNTKTRFMAEVFLEFDVVLKAFDAPVKQGIICKQPDLGLRIQLGGYTTFGWHVTLATLITIDDDSLASPYQEVLYPSSCEAMNATVREFPNEALVGDLAKCLAEVEDYCTGDAAALHRGEVVGSCDQQLGFTQVELLQAMWELTG